MATHSRILAWRIPKDRGARGGGVGGYSPWGRKESDMTEAIELLQHQQGLPGLDVVCNDVLSLPATSDSRGPRSGLSFCCVSCSVVSGSLQPHRL